MSRLEAISNIILAYKKAEMLGSELVKILKALGVSQHEIEEALS